MSATNYERVGRALELLRAGLHPYVRRELEQKYREAWRKEASACLHEDWADLRGEPRLDAHALLVIMWDKWGDVFGRTLGHAERSLIAELREIRNRWAHQEPYSADDTYRALDTVTRLLTAISAEEAHEVDRMKREFLRLSYEASMRRQAKKVGVASTEGQPLPGLKPWREVATPHPDVASGRYLVAQFAADLAQVYRGEGEPEYSDAREFFRRTFLTEGLSALLRNALQRLRGEGGDPVLELQTNFGGGKTHSMMALYHLFSGRSLSELPGAEAALADRAGGHLPGVRRAVLVGTSMSPAHTRLHPDGVETRTLWGELAWQLGQADGYRLVAESDAQGVSPGSDILRDLFTRFGPCLVLIDEWVTYVRQLYTVRGLPGGSFEANISFVQALTEAARQVSTTIVVASIPSSTIEIGGEGGAEALTRLEHAFGRIKASWRPASAEEGFEIVRRRLFQPLEDTGALNARDAVVGGFARAYRDRPEEYPTGCKEARYEERLRAAYPIHPELFDQLYGAWSSLDKFQRTRGVLRLMAAVIHSLWERNDSSLMILPGTVPIDDSAVHHELANYLEAPWQVVMEKDVDGPHSTPLAIDREIQGLGRYSACRRVARTIYMGSAPTLSTANPGIDERAVKLGCVQPGENPAVFGDALRRLTDKTTHLYVDKNRYWFSTQPGVTRLAQDRAATYDQHDVWDELKTRLKDDRQRGDFVRVHPTPSSTEDVPDEKAARLVILGPEHPHAAKVGDSEARHQALIMLEQRGNGPRYFRNTLVFLAPDRTRLADLEVAVRQYLAWDSIASDRESLNLDVFQTNLATTKRKQADEAVTVRIQETFVWVLVPAQPDVRGPIEWEETRVSGPGPLAERVSKKLVNDELLITGFAGTRLRLALDTFLWTGKDHMPVKQLWENFASYVYLPRLEDENVLVRAIENGLSQVMWTETFAFADSQDPATGRYLGLRAGRAGEVVISGGSLLVKPEAAQRQMALDRAAGAAGGVDAAAGGGATGAGGAGGVGTGAGGTADVGTGAGGEGVATPWVRGAETTATGAGPGVSPATTEPRRFFGQVGLEPIRLGRDAATIADEVIKHLVALAGAEVEVTLEIKAVAPGGVPHRVVQTVTENCRTLRFRDFGFEEE